MLNAKWLIGGTAEWRKGRKGRILIGILMAGGENAIQRPSGRYMPLDGVLAANHRDSIGDTYLNSPIRP